MATCNRRRASPLHSLNYRNVAIAAIFSMFFDIGSTSPFSPSTALAFSHQHAKVGPIGTSSSSYRSSALGRGGGLVQLGERSSVPPSATSLFTDKSFPSVGDFRPSIALFSTPSDSDNESLTSGDDATATKELPSLKQDIQNIATLIGAQALLIPISVFFAYLLHIPNRGLGLGFEWNAAAAVAGIQWTAPLFGVAFILKVIEPYAPALQDVTKATQRSVLAVMGSQRRPVFALIISILLGAAAGWGEELLFRGVFQTVLSQKWGDGVALGVSGIVFGLLHAVTPIYALLAGAASVFFGYLYSSSGNLAVPIICHAVYDVGALMWAHWSVTALSSDEQDEILDFGGPGAPIMNAKNNFD